MRNNFLKSFGRARFGGGRARVSPVISAVSRPAMAALDDGQTPADGFTVGVYASTEGAISSAVVSYAVNGVAQAGDYDLSAGDSVRAIEVVTDSVGNSRSFYASVIVTPSVALANTAAPGVIGTPEVGQTISLGGDTWDGSAERSFTYLWTNGATTQTYVVRPSDNLTQLGGTVTASDGFTTVSADAPAVAITYPAPVAAGGLEDQSYDLDSGVQTVDAAADFTNAVGGTWSVTGVGVTISQDGQLSITTSSERTGSVVNVTYTNSGDSASSAFAVSVADPATSAAALLLSVGGQSNARKAGNSGATPDAKYADMGETYIWSDASVAFLDYAVGTASGSRGALDSGVWGTEAEFIYQLRQAGDTRAIYIVKEAVNGNALGVVVGGDWSPSSSGERYDGYVTQAVAAKAAMVAGGVTEIEEVFFWNQGEADSTDDVNAAAYGANLAGLLSSLDSDGAFSATGTFIIERIRPCTSDLGTSPYTRQFQVREAQEAAAVEVGRIKIISLDFDESNFASLHPVEPWTQNIGLRAYASYMGTYDATYGAVADDAPDAFTFTDQTGVAPSTEITSGQRILAGIGGHSDVSITGGEYRILNPDDTIWQDWTSAAGTIHPYQKLQLRVTSSGSVSTATDVTVTVGGVLDTWTVTTYAEAPSYEAETTAFIAQASANGGGSIAGADATALDTFYASAKSETWWPKLARLYLRLGDEVASRLDLAGQAVSLYDQGLGETTYWAWSAALGWTGLDNANGGLGVNVDLSTDWGQNSGAFGVWYSALATNTRGDVSSTGGTSFMRYVGGASRYLLNSAANTNGSGLTTALGLRAVVRDGAASIRLHGPDGAQIHSGTAASSAPVSEDIYIGNPTGTYSDASILGGFVASEALNAAELASIATICGALQDHFAQ